MKMHQAQILFLNPDQNCLKHVLQHFLATGMSER